MALLPYQLLLVTPATSPSSASWRKHRRHNANLRRYARGRPQRLQRLRRRTLNFGVFNSFAILAVVAIVFSSLSALSAFSAALLGPERHAQQLQQLSRFLVGPRRRDYRDVHPARLVDLHVVDLGKQQLVFQAERVVAAAVEALRRDAAEIADAGQRDGNQPVEELPHALAAQGDHRADRHALPDLELCDRLLRARAHRLM